MYLAKYFTVTSIYEHKGSTLRTVDVPVKCIAEVRIEDMRHGRGEPNLF